MSRGRYRNRRWSSLLLQDVEDILFPSACVALYKRDMLEKTGFFDDDFFAYAEDSDLGLRGRLAGWDAVAATQAVVYHKYSRTGGILSPFKVYLVERNHYWVVWKNFPVRLLFVLPFFSIWRYFAQLYVVLTGSGTGRKIPVSGSRTGLIKAQIRGIYDGYKGMVRMLRRRSRLHKYKRLTDHKFSELLHRYRISFRELLDND